MFNRLRYRYTFFTCCYINCSFLLLQTPTCNPDYGMTTDMIAVHADLPAASRRRRATSRRRRAVTGLGTQTNLTVELTIVDEQVSKHYTHTKPSNTSNTTPNTTPSTIPNTKDSIIPNTTPSTTPNTTPSTTLSTTPDTTSSTTLSTTPDTTLDTTPNTKPSTKSRNTPCNTVVLSIGK